MGARRLTFTPAAASSRRYVFPSHFVCVVTWPRLLSSLARHFGEASKMQATEAPVSYQAFMNLAVRPLIIIIPAKGALPL